MVAGRDLQRGPVEAARVDDGEGFADHSCGGHSVHPHPLPEGPDGEGGAEGDENDGGEGDGVGDGAEGDLGGAAEWLAAAAACVTH